MLGFAMRHKLATTYFATAAAALAVGQWSTASAGSSFKVVTAPSDPQQAPDDTGSSIKAVTVPRDPRQAPTAAPGSSFKVVTAPAKGQQGPIVKADSSIKIVILPTEAKEAQAEVVQAVVPRPDELPPEQAEQQTNPNVSISSLRPSAAVALRMGTQRQVELNQNFASIFVADPSVVEVVPLTDRSAMIKPLKEGASYVNFLDSKGKLITALAVSIDNFINVPGKPVTDPEVVTDITMEIHNKSKLDSQTNYRCGSDGCHYTGELTVQEPAPLPPGYFSGTYTYPNLPSSPTNQPSPQIPYPPPPRSR